MPVVAGVARRPFLLRVRVLYKSKSWDFFQHGSGRGHWQERVLDFNHVLIMPLLALWPGKATVLVRARMIFTT